MKMKFTLLKLLFFITSFLMVTSCEKDFQDVPIQGGATNITSKHISLKQLDQQLVEKIEGKITLVKNIDKAARGIQNKFEYNSDLGLYIDTENGSLITNNGISFYTFPMYREGEEKLENIIFTPKNSTEMEAFTVKYNVNVADFESLTFKELGNLNPEYQKVGEGSSNLCIDFITTQTLYNNCNMTHSNGATCQAQTVTYTTTFCSQGGGSGNYGNNTSPLGNNNTAGGTGVSTTPLGSPSPHGGAGSNQQNFPPTPCGRLQKGTSRNEYKTKFTQYNTSRAIGLAIETGFVTKKKRKPEPNPNNETMLVFEDGIASGGNSLSITPGSLNYTHVHNIHLLNDSDGNSYNAGVSMLSPPDLLALLTTCYTANTIAGESPLDAFGIMISNEGIFAINILEPLSPQDYSNATSKWTRFAREYNNESGKIITDNTLTASQRKKQVQVMFLKLLSILGLQNKIGLFEATAESDGTPSTTTSWDRKVLSANGRDIDVNPC